MNAIKKHLSKSEKTARDCLKHIKNNIIAYLLTLILTGIGINIKMSYDNQKDIARIREDSVTKLNFEGSMSNMDRRLYKAEKDLEFLMDNHRLVTRGDTKVLIPFVPFMDVDKALLN